MPFELQTLVRLGLSPTDALVAGTRGGAEACRIAAECGTVEVGKRADILVLDGNPLQDISAMERVVMVMTNGRVFDPGSLTDLSARVAQV